MCKLFFLLSCIIVCYFYSCLRHVSGIALCLIFQINKKNLCVRGVAAPVIEYSESLKETQKIKAGKSLVLTVNILGAPTPKASWRRGDAELKSGLEVSVEGDGTFSRLTVKNTSAEVSGKYKVVAENSVGSDSAEFDVVILGRFSLRILSWVSMGVVYRAAADPRGRGVRSPP